MKSREEDFSGDEVKQQVEKWVVKGTNIWIVGESGNVEGLRKLCSRSQ